MPCLLADIDVAHPDEKSLITYVSSLYDVFPQVPTVEDSLRDNVSAHTRYNISSVLRCQSGQLLRFRRSSYAFQPWLRCYACHEYATTLAWTLLKHWPRETNYALLGVDLVNRQDPLRYF